MGSIVDRRYVLRREIACGGMGLVFEAEHVVTRARVAVKTLRGGGLESHAAHLRMEREARALGAIRHPMVVAVNDAGLCAMHGPYISMELLEGRPLDGILVSRRTLPVGQAVAVAVQVCQALESVHAAGYVHRDVKPANVLVSRTWLGDQVELIDFGVAKRIEEADDDASKLTQAGELLGTTDYMSPEQLMNDKPVDARTDVYATGVMLYECLAGEVPLSGPPTQVIARMLAGAKPAPIREHRPDVPLALEAAVRGALELALDRRFPTPRAFAQACVEAISGALPSLDLLGLPNAPAPVQLAMPRQAPAREPGGRARQFVRAPYVAPVRIVSASGEANDGRIEDISEGGILVMADHECSPDAEVRARMPLPASGRVVVVKGVTRWVKSGRGQRAIGIEFVELSDEARAEIRHYVALMNASP